MKILNHHIRNAVVGMTALVVLIFFGLQTFVGFINELRNTGYGTYGALQVFNYVSLTLPSVVYPLIPAAALIGCLIGLGRLAAQSELIVMRAAGVSKIQITLSVIYATILMLVFITVIGEWAAPHLKNFAEDYKYHAQTGSSSAIKLGVWLRDGNNFLHFDSVQANGQVQGITRFQFDRQRLLSTSHATSGERKNGQWVFKNIYATTLQPKAVTTQHYPEQIWPISFDPQLLSINELQISQTPLWELYRYIHYLKQSGLSATRYEFAFWKRIMQPLATLVMIGLAVPFIFGSLRTVTMGLRILIGVIIGFSFYTLNEFLGPFSLVYQLSPVWAATMPVILFAMIDAVLLWRIK
jgi:lipopolysaccharide export system permease protein